MRHLLMVTIALLMVACGRSERSDMDHKAVQDLDRLQQTIIQAKDSEQERAAFSELSRTCRDLGYTYSLTLHDSGGVVIPVSSWDEDRERLQGAKVELVLMTVDQLLQRRFTHQLIDPANFVYLLLE
jgi:hypothetical protein